MLRIQIKIINILSLLIFVNIFPPIFCQQNISESCDPEDWIVAQWYGQVSEFVQRNVNITQNVKELQGNVQRLEHQMGETQKKLAQCVEDQNAKAEIVIQRRMDGSVNFQRDWSDFKRGFGNSSGEFFIGLDKLHKLTNTRPYELLIVMEDWEGDRRFALYNAFVVGNEAEKYALKQLGTYSGSAGDSLTYHLGQKFTTRDQDNDIYERNCAVVFTGAWWHKNCHQSNLNGQYRQGTTVEFAIGVNWLAFKGYHYSLKFVEMILRPR